jgi:hypothetical protein
MKNLLISTLSAAALAASVGVAVAQGADGGGAGPGGAGAPTQDLGPSAGGDPGAPGAGSGAEGRGTGGETMRGPDAGTDRGDGGDRGKAAEQRAPSSKDADKPASRVESKDGDKPATRAEGKDGAKDKDADAGTKRAEDPKAGDNSAEGKSAGEAGQDNSGASVSLTGEKRTQVQKAFSSHRSDAKVDIDVDVSVGVVVPRHVHLVAIPEDIVVIVPAWRRYRYILVGNTICIIDPDTYTIVEVIVLA